MLGQKRKFEFFVIFIVLCCSSVAKATGIPHTADSQQPTLMLVPLKNFVDFMSVGIEGGNAQQELLAEDGTRHTDNSTFTYDLSLGKKLGDNLIAGVRFGPSGVPLINLGLNLDIQYDLVKNDFCKFSVSAMYGGIIYPGPRYGAGVLGSCFFTAWRKVGAIFFSYQSIVEQKNFSISSNENGGFSDVNYIEAEIKYNIALMGIEYIVPISGVRNLSILLSVGLQTPTDTKITYEDHSPSGYAISKGNWSALEFRAYVP